MAMIGWHGTNGDFDAFDESYFGSDRGRSPNGRLGVWVYLAEGFADKAGARVLRVEADIPEGTIARLSIQRMMKDHRAASHSDDPHAHMDGIRRDLLAQGYLAIQVVEDDGRSMMGVILDPARITLVEDLSAAPRM